MVKRYDIHGYYGMGCDVEEHINGDWVDYDDYKKIVEAFEQEVIKQVLTIDELYEEIRLLHEQVEAAEARIGF